MGVLSKEIQREQLQVGDHIYTWRRAFTYAHHGLFLSMSLLCSRGFPLLFLAKRCPYPTALGGSVYCISKWLSDIGVRPDASRIAVEDLVNGRRP